MLLPWHKCQWCSYPTIHLHRNVGETQFRLGGRDQGENFEAIIEVDTYQCWKTMWKCWKTNINVLTHTSGVSQHSYTVRRLLQTWYVFYWMEHVFVDVFFIYFFFGVGVGGKWSSKIGWEICLGEEGLCQPNVDVIFATQIPQPIFSWAMKKTLVG